MERFLKWNHRIIQSIFSNRIFIAICAVAFSAQAILQPGLPLGNLLNFFLIIGASLTCYIFSFAGIPNKRNISDRKNESPYYENLPRWNQAVILLVFVIAFFYFGEDYGKVFSRMQAGEWFLLLIFPIVALFYYAQTARSGNNKAEYDIWIKPMVTGFCWAGMVTVYPALFYGLTNQLQYSSDWIVGLLFLKNFLFMSVLSFLLF